jgi:hypothetical protein
MSLLQISKDWLFGTKYFPDLRQVTDNKQMLWCLSPDQGWILAYLTDQQVVRAYSQIPSHCCLPQGQLQLCVKTHTSIEFIQK